MCSCDFTQSNIQNNEFSCRSIEDSVVFRAEVIYASFVYTADELVEFISEWVQTAPSLVVGPARSRVDVDSSCPTELDSFLSKDCVSTDQGDNLAAIVGGSIGGVCALLICTFTVIVVISLQKRKSGSFRYSHNNH